MPRADCPSRSTLRMAAYDMSLWFPLFLGCDEAHRCLSFVLVYSWWSWSHHRFQSLSRLDDKWQVALPIGQMYRRSQSSRDRTRMMRTRKDEQDDSTTRYNVIAMRNNLQRRNWQTKKARLNGLRTWRCDRVRPMAGKYQQNEHTGVRKA